MPKLKFSDEKGTFTLKNLDICHLELIRSILNVTRLGSDDIYKNCAFELCDSIDELFSNDDWPIPEEWWDVCKVTHSVDQDGYLTIEVSDESECDGLCTGCKCR